MPPEVYISMHVQPTRCYGVPKTTYELVISVSEWNNKLVFICKTLYAQPILSRKDVMCHTVIPNMNSLNTLSYYRLNKNIVGPINDIKPGQRLLLM